MTEKAESLGSMMDIGFCLDDNVSLLAKVAQKINAYRGGYVYIFFEMGSIQLDIDNPLNLIKVYPEGYTEIYNDDNGETTIIKNRAIKGFVFEDKPLSLDDIEEVEYDPND